MPAQVPILLTGTTLIDRAIGGIRGALNQLLADPFLAGMDTGRVAVAVTDTIVKHGLGRIPKNFVQTYINAAATIFVVAADATTVTIRASAPCTASYRVW